MNKLHYIYSFLFLFAFSSQSYSSFQEKNYEGYYHVKFIPVKSDYLSGEMVLAKFDCKKRGHLSYKPDSPLKTFVDEIKNYCQTNKLNYLGIDISKRFLTTTQAKLLFNDLKQLEEKIIYINLSETEVDWKITNVLKNLLGHESFNYLNISNTEASKNLKTVESLSSEEIRKKVISISQKVLPFVNESQFSPERIEIHKNYYSEFSKY